MRLKLKLERKKSLPDLPIPKGAMTWLMFCFFLSVGWHAIWHIPELPVWALIAVVPMSIFSYRRIVQEKPLPSQVLRIVLTIACVAGIFLHFGFPLGRDPGITTLILLSSLKLMELKTRRDFMFVVYMCYFIVFGNFLYDQSLPDLAFMIAAVILLTAAVLRLNHPSEETVKLSYLLKFSARLFLMAFPMAVMLFLIFPRAYGHFLNFPRDPRIYKSGFRDTLQPGDVSQLAQSNDTAMEVEFPNKDMPGQKDLYFRGLLLWYTDGKAWYQGYMPSRTSQRDREEAEGIFHYITLQPHHQKWLFGLDRPVMMQMLRRELPDNIYQALFDVKSPLRYGVISRPDAGYHFLPKVHRKWALQLPDEISPRIMELAREWRSSSTTDADIVQAAENFFKSGKFWYTLNPGTMDPGDPLGDFLFSKRQGFCEHFAASFALSMRAAGVPARVVVGYQGGEYNPVGEYLEVRQSDAHAWAEVWLEEGGENNRWQRIDPTAWVSPERIQYGLEVSQRISANLEGADRDEALQDALRGNFLTRAWKFVKNHWENIKYQWDAWIITYDRFRQRNFFSSLGFGRVDRMTLFIVVLILVPIFLYIISLFMRRKSFRADPLVKLYLRFCVKLEKAGLPRYRWEGPVHYGQRAVKKFPGKAGIIHQVTDLFVHLRYGRLEVTKERLKLLKQQIRAI